MSEKLKPCPFCGGKAYIEEESDAKSCIYNVARCEECGVEVCVYVDMTKTIKWNKQKVIERWNKRSNPWQTGTPTEEGWYLCAYDTDIYLANYWVGCGWLKQYRAEGIDCRQGLLAWQKIEPYEGTDNE